MPLDIDDDEYVAKLLAKDAKKLTKTYDLVGLDAFNPRRTRIGAPKPNTNFLRHIIRQTDSHNAALLAKEAEESSSRLRLMNRGREKERTEAVDRAKRNIEGRLSPPPHDGHSQVRHSARSNDNARHEHSHKRDEKGTHRSERPHSRSRRHRDSSRDRRRHKRRHEDSDDDRATHKSKRSRNYQDNGRRSHRNSETEEKRSHDRSRRRRRSHSRSRSPSRSESPSRKRRRHRNRSRSPRLVSPSHKASRSRRHHSRTPASDSDPLEAIVGPLPPPPEPTVRLRGRGALRANSTGIESRFASAYDPSMDMRPGSDAEDDWGEALEVMRDRERWKQQGAERLRAAGFKDEQVKKWEKGGDPLEGDVVWSKKGQDREWDRGKVVDEDGDVELKADWGRLK